MSGPVALYTFYVFTRPIIGLQASAVLAVKGGLGHLLAAARRHHFTSNFFSFAFLSAWE
jgi:hypothetical protein